MKYRYVSIILIVIISITFLGAKVAKPKNYSKVMVNLLASLNYYAKSRNDKFLMIGNGGYNLYNPKAKTKIQMLNAVDGVIIEDAFTHSDKKAMQSALKCAVKNNKKAFSIEYKSFKGNKDVVSYKAKKNTKLNKIPKFRNKRYDVEGLSDVKNFMVILDPDKYKTKKKYLNALRNTDYDLIFVDLYYHDKPLTKADVKSLKVKKNGGKRLVCSYLSVGEAENYRYYWKSSWKKKSKRPEWIAKENEHWHGNYKVCYWYSAWQKILYGYLDKIINVGFNGVYLDVIDAYEYFG